MFRQITYAGFLTGSLLLAGCASTSQAKLSAVGYGTVTEAGQREKDTSSARSSGAIIGGLIGLASSSGRSLGTTAARTAVGAGVGSAIGGSGAAGTEMIYTVDMVGGGSLRVVMDRGNFRVGDCVSIERGRTNNMRMVSQEFCVNNARVPEQFKEEDVKEAYECALAKDELLAAKTTEAVELAHIKMNLLCED